MHFDLEPLVWRPLPCTHLCIYIHDPSDDEVGFDATCLLVAVGGEGEPVTVSVTGQS